MEKDSLLQKMPYDAEMSVSFCTIFQSFTPQFEDCYFQTLFSALEYEALSMNLLIRAHEIHFHYEKPHICICGAKILTILYINLAFC